MPLTNPLKFFQSGDNDKPDNERTRYTGQILHVNKKTEGGGYGFIKCQDIPFERIFFHWTELIGYKFMDLEKEMEVSFFAYESVDWTDDKGTTHPGKGWIAQKIRVEVGD